MGYCVTECYSHFFFFFSSRRRHTRSKRDWSSDVCSSDLLSFYPEKMVAPLNLSPLYMLPAKVNPWETPFVLSYGVVVGLTAIVLALRRRVPGVPAAWVAYIVVLLPVLGIFQSGPQIAADRYTYLAGLGWATLAGAGVLWCWGAT